MTCRVVWGEKGGERKAPEWDRILESLFNIHLVLDLRQDLEHRGVEGELLPDRRELLQRDLVLLPRIGYLP